MQKCPCCGEPVITSTALSTLRFTGSTQCPACSRYLKVKRNIFSYIPLVYTTVRIALNQMFDIGFHLADGWELSLMTALWLLAIWRLSLQEDHSKNQRLQRS